MAKIVYATMQDERFDRTTSFSLVARSMADAAQRLYGDEARTVVTDEFARNHVKLAPATATPASTIP
jgi:hypothetical protein